MKKIKVAITGGIGSGKSEFSKILIEKGLTVLNADKIAKNILFTDEQVKSKVIKIFGNESYNEEGVNTKYLAQKVFTDEEQIKKLNSIVHPVTIKKIDEMMNEILKEKNIVFVEAALIYEAEMEELFDYVILITAEERIRIDRVIERDKVDEEEVLDRMQNQITETEKRKYADFVIDNDKELNDLRIKTETLITILKSISGTN